MKAKLNQTIFTPKVGYVLVDKPKVNVQGMLEFAIGTRERLWSWILRLQDIVFTPLRTGWM